MGDEGFAAWYQEQYRRVFASVLLVSGDHAATGDAVDEAFARAWERWPRVARDGLAGRVDIHRCPEPAAALGAPAARASRRSRRLSYPRPRSTSHSGRPCARLPPRERELIALRYVAGLTEAQIASTLGIAPGTVARGLHDARAHLHTMLAPEEDRA